MEVNGGHVVWLPTFSEISSVPLKNDTRMSKNVHFVRTVRLNGGKKTNAGLDFIWGIN